MTEAEAKVLAKLDPEQYAQVGDRLYKRVFANGRCTNCEFFRSGNGKNCVVPPELPFCGNDQWKTIDFESSSR